MGNYVETNLRPNEHIIGKAEISWVPVVPAAVGAGVIFIIGLIIKHGVWGFLVAAVLLVSRVLAIYSTELGVTDKKIIGKTGVFVANSLDTYLGKIDNISISESFAGKLFGYATIQLCTTSARLRFNYVQDAMKFKNMVLDCIEAAETRKMATQAQLGQMKFNQPVAPADAPDIPEA
jgi:uncharacterized membrane protein YdbT with pleckstrin-like domain